MRCSPDIISVASGSSEQGTDGRSAFLVTHGQYRFYSTVWLAAREAAGRFDVSKRHRLRCFPALSEPLHGT